MNAGGSPWSGRGSLRMLKRGLAVLDSATGHIEAFLLAGAVLFLSGLLIVHVLGRQLLGAGVPGQVELTQMTLVIMTFAGLGYGVRRARHISMSAVYDQLRGVVRKGLLVGISVLTGALMFYLAWHAWDYTSTMMSRGRVSSALGIPLWIPYMMAPIGLAMAGVQYWLTAFRNLVSSDIYRSFTELERYENPDDVIDQERAAYADQDRHDDGGAR